MYIKLYKLIATELMIENYRIALKKTSYMYAQRMDLFKLF